MSFQVFFWKAVSVQLFPISSLPQHFLIEMRQYLLCARLYKECSFKECGFQRSESTQEFVVCITPNKKDCRIQHARSSAAEINLVKNERRVPEQDVEMKSACKWSSGCKMHVYLCLEKKIWTVGPRRVIGSNRLNNYSLWSLWDW